MGAGEDEGRSSGQSEAPPTWWYSKMTSESPEWVVGIVLIENERLLVFRARLEVDLEWNGELAKQILRCEESLCFLAER